MNDLTSGIETELTCGICSDIFYLPITCVPCFHSFCAPCFSEYFFKDYNKNCPECRTSIYQIGKNHKLVNLVEKYLNQNPLKKRSPTEITDLNLKNKITDEVLRKPIKFCKKKYDDDDDNDNDDDDDDDDDDDQIFCRDCLNSNPNTGLKCTNHTLSSHLACSGCNIYCPSIPNNQCFSCKATSCNTFWKTPSTCLFKLNPLNYQYHNLVINQDAVFNKYETEVTLLYIKKFNIDLNKIWDDILLKTKIDANKLGCEKCINNYFNKYLYMWRMTIPNDEIIKISSRPCCWYGIECRTAKHNDLHAKKYNHLGGKSNPPS